MVGEMDKSHFHGQSNSPGGHTVSAVGSASVLLLHGVILL